jgi:hypothetical protein
MRTGKFTPKQMVHIVRQGESSVPIGESPLGAFENGSRVSEPLQPLVMRRWGGSPGVWFGGSSGGS